MNNKILIAEDENNIRRLIASYLLREGFQVVEAVDGQQALEQFRSQEGIILVMLDVMMPGRDGYEVCREIRAKSQVPILILTAKDTEHDEITGFSCGADEFISKPFSPAVLVTRIKNLLKRTSANDLNDLSVERLKIFYRERG